VKKYGCDALSLHGLFGIVANLPAQNGHSSPVMCQQYFLPFFMVKTPSAQKILFSPFDHSGQHRERQFTSICQIPYTTL
jgi:hypothetical protein